MSANEIFNQGITEINCGNSKKALTLFNKVLELAPNHVDSLIKKGNILGKFGKYVDAISIYDKVIELEPQNVLALLNKGLALHYLSAYDKAITCFDIVLKTKPNNAIALYNKASSLAKQGKVKDGLEVLEHAVKIDYSFKYKAKLDVDFEHIKTNNDFKKIIL
jgi:tetratricopeptide (TPR) repeat protein